MNSTDKAVTVADKVIVVDELVDSGVYGNYQLGLVRISRTNRKRFNEVALRELAANIEDVGVVQPILIRPVEPTEAEPQIYEIVAGERRYRASIMAGLQTIPGLLRSLTDKQAREIQIFENLQREDPHPMEEAEGFQELLLAGGYNADQLAEKLHKSRSYIYGRLKLCALTSSVRESFLDGKIAADIALLIARIPVPALQTKAAKEVMEPDFYGAPKSVRAARQYLRSRYMLELGGAVFAIKDATLVPAAGACNTCPKMSANQPEIFDDLKSADVCTDPDCFAEKRTAHATRVKDAAIAKGQNVIVGAAAKKIMPDSYGGVKGGYVDLDKEFYGNGGRTTYRKILGKATPAGDLLENPHFPGVMIKVAKEADLAVLLEHAGIKAPETDSARSAAQRANEKQQEAKAKIERAYRRQLFSAIRGKADDQPREWQERAITKKLMRSCPDAHVQFVMEAYGLVPADYEAGREDGVYVYQQTKLDRWIDKFAIDRVRALCRDLALVDDLTVNTYTGGNDQPMSLLTAAEAVGVDAKRIFTAVAAEAKAKLDAKKKPAAKKQKTAAPAQKDLKLPQPAGASSDTASAEPERKEPAAARPDGFDSITPETLPAFIQTNPQCINDLAEFALENAPLLVAPLEKTAESMGYVYGVDGFTKRAEEGPAAASPAPVAAKPAPKATKRKQPAKAEADGWPWPTSQTAADAAKVNP